LRILVYEFASGGGLAGRDVPASLAREGAAMRAALVGDLAATECHQIVTTAGAREVGLGRGLSRGVEVVTLPEGDRAREAGLDRLIGSVDAVWLIAPETDGCLARLAARVERRRKALLGSSSDAVRRASDKASLPRRLARLGVRHPATRALDRDVSPERAACEIGYPVIVKPVRGAGSQGVCLVRHARELRCAIDRARRANRGGRVILQEYIQGVDASVSLVADGRRATALTVNAQALGSSPRFAYRGGETPFDHALAVEALAAAVDACRALPGLRGFVGVDVILTASDVVVIEVNPRLTTAYLGVRAAIDENVARLALAACAGHLPTAPHPCRHVRFTASGQVVVLRGAA
jgi:predicted ATP-grasp superfamily ATP-dependent carboligase